MGYLYCYYLFDVFECSCPSLSSSTRSPLIVSSGLFRFLDSDSFSSVTFYSFKNSNFRKVSRKIVGWEFLFYRFLGVRKPLSEICTFCSFICLFTLFPFVSVTLLVFYWICGVLCWVRTLNTGDSLVSIIPWSGKNFEEQEQIFPTTPPPSLFIGVVYLMFLFYSLLLSQVSTFLNFCNSWLTFQLWNIHT